MPINKLLSIIDASESVKTIREIRKENRGEDKLFRDLTFFLEPEKYHYGDKDKHLSVK